MGWMRRVRGLLQRDKLSAEWEEELRFHIDMREQSNARSGMPQDQAHRKAMRQFGNPARLKERLREIDVFTLPETVWQDLRFAARMLRKHPGFTTLAVLALGLGIGVNTAIFTVYRAFLLRGIDAKDPQRMVDVGRVDFAGKYDPAFSYPDFEAYRDHIHSFSGLVAATSDEAALSGVGNIEGMGRSIGGALTAIAGFRMPKLVAGGAEFVPVSIVSENYFSVLGVGAARGRVFTLGDVAFEAEAPVALISENYWERRFGREASLIGKAVKLNGVTFTVVGITPHDFMGTNLNVPGFWIPMHEQPLLRPGGGLLRDRENQCCRMYGRLADGVTRDLAQAELNVFGEGLRKLHASNSESSRPGTISLYPGSPFGREVDSGLNFVLSVIMCAVAMVLVIACANVASLQLARSAARQKEIGVRLSLGATRTRLIRQLLTESALLGVVSGAVSLLLTGWVLHVLLVRLSASLPAEWGTLALHLAPDMRVFTYVFFISMVAGVMFGLAPALESSRTDLTAALKEEGRQFAFLSRMKRFMRGGLIAVQIAVCLVLMVAGGILLRSSINVLHMDAGYQTTNMLFLDLQFPDGFGYSRDKEVSEIRSLADRVRGLPGVESVTVGRAPDGGGFRWAAVSPAGPQGADSRAAHNIYYTYVQPNYFQTLGIPIRLGTGFGAGGQRGPGAVLNESAAQQLWPGKNPIGLTLVIDARNQFHTNAELVPEGASYQVIGVVGDTRGVLLDDSDRSKVFLSLPPDRLEDRPLLVRTGGDPKPILNAVGTALRALDSNLVVYSETLDDKLTESPQFVFSRCSALFASVLAAFGLLLASVGIYGTVSYAVVRRTRELGIRMALGAEKRHVVRLVISDSLRPVLWGMAIGFVAALGAARVIRAILFGVSSFDPVSFLGVSTLLLAVASLAAYVPARRATRVDPAVALRFD